MELGCGLSFSEMVSAEGIIYANKKTEHYYDNSIGARPFGVQLFTARPHFLFEAIRRIDNDSIDLFDINMGCPVKKVVKKGAGSALMKTPGLAAELIMAARNATSKPVTVKIRSGWDESSINCVEFAEIAEEAGASAITLHPRTRMQEFRGQANWELISEVKKAVNIPVIGNGDIKTIDDANRMTNESGCDAVMIGRAAYRNPWIFTGQFPSPAEKKEMLLRYIDMLQDGRDERITICNMRAFLSRFAKGYKDVSKFLTTVHQTKDVNELRTTIEAFSFI
jgi:nifR3 family TIM-barrel protein